MRKASSSCLVTPTGCWLAEMQIVGSIRCGRRQSCDGGRAGHDALSRTGAVQHPNVRDRTERKLERQATAC